MTEQSLFTMTRKDLEEASRKLSGLVIDIERKKLDKKTYTAEMKAEIDHLQKKITNIAREIAEATIDDEPLAGVKEALDGLQSLAEKDGATISMIHDGKETVLADGKNGRKKK